jgi:hypothetical protein
LVGVGPEDLLESYGEVSNIIDVDRILESLEKGREKIETEIVSIVEEQEEKKSKADTKLCRIIKNVRGGNNNE